ncbi:MAG: NTP transferase domain-containing protein [Selenomonadaceae bacterium]|nr:NTP transferase domain-containing protein [Selenomonadaceae bacterium]
MTLTRTDFDILTGDAAKYPRELVDERLKFFRERGLLRGDSLTADGLKVLEPYKVRRAIFIVAGIGERLIPITLNTPKPLVKVHGVRIIDRLIDACLAADIEEIYVVRGYLGEQFDLLLRKYPMLKFVDNPLYNEANNISSAKLVAHLMSRAYVLEGDLLLYNPALIRKYEFTPNFLGIEMARSDDWCFEVRDGVIVKQKIGGLNCWQEVGISFWDETSAAQLAKDLPAAFDLPGGREFYWDEVPLKIFAEHYRIEIRPCTKADVVEIDTFGELKAIDRAYAV